MLFGMVATARKPQPEPGISSNQMLAALVIEQGEAIAALHGECAELRRRLDLVEPAPRPNWLNLKRAAGQTGYSPEAIRLWCVAGAVDAELIGGRWSVNPAGLPMRKGRK